MRKSHNVMRNVTPYEAEAKKFTTDLFVTDLFLYFV